MIGSGVHPSAPGSHQISVSRRHVVRKPALRLALGVVPKTPENPSQTRSATPNLPGCRSRLFLTRTGDRFARKRYSSPHLFIQAANRTMTDPEKGENRRGAIAGLAIAVVLLVTGLWLAHELTAASKLQDCLMTGRTNCAVIPAQ